jgi:HEAT repeat protein
MLLAATEEPMLGILLFALALATPAYAADNPSKAELLQALGGYEESASADSLKALGSDVPAVLREIASDTTLTHTQRARAIHALGWFPDASTREFLVMQAHGTDTLFVRKAVYALANGWGDGAIDELVLALANHDVQIRMAAAYALGNVGTESAKLALGARLPLESDPTVKTTIEKAMRK